MASYGDASYGTQDYGDGKAYFPTFPAVKAWIAFTTDPGDTPVWEEITAYIRSASIRRGRQHELDRFETGTAVLLLDNRDRRFDPDYSASAYYPNVVPMRRIKITANYGVEYPLFAGYVENWPQRYSQPHEANVTVNCVDGFRIFAAMRMPESPWTLELRKDSPTAWWRLGESTTAATAGDSASGIYGGEVQSASFGVSSLIASDSDTGANFSTSQAMIRVGQNAMLNSFPFTVEGWLRTTPDRTNTKVIFYGGFNDVVSAKLAGNTTDPGHGGQIGFQLVRNDLTSSAFSSVAVDDGVAHHFVCVANSASSLVVYVDGVNVTSTTATAATGFPSMTNGWAIGNTPTPYFGDYKFNGLGTAGGIDEIAVYNGKALSADRVLAHFQAGATAWSGDTTGARLGRILDWVGWPATDRDIDTGNSTMGAATFSGTVFDFIQGVQAVEQGAIYMTTDGVIRLTERHAALGAAPVAIFSD